MKRGLSTAPPSIGPFPFSGLMRRILTPNEVSPTPKPETTPDRRLANHCWQVTWQAANGDIQTTEVLINGIWRMADLKEQARKALHQQHDIPNAAIIRLSMDCRT